MKLRVLIAGLIFGVAALAADSGAELFQKAVTEERAAGNLEEAIKLYQRVAKEFASDRALAAKALVQEARCYEKLGQDKAVKVYEQVAREFGDQREFAETASARLAVLRQGEHAAPAPATMTQRQIELPRSIPMNWFDRFLQTDGQRAIYKDETGALVISDLAGKEKRVFFKPKVDTPDYIVPSRDFSIVFMELMRPDQTHTSAVIKTDGTGYREVGVDSRCSEEWSWDNRYVLLCQSLPDGALQPLRYSLADGAIRKTQDPYRVRRLSPDGRFVAYTTYDNAPGEIFVVPSEGGESQLVFANAMLLDWTRDGQYLAINSTQSGSDALYLLPMKDGKRSGDPVFVRYGSFEQGRTMSSGSLVYQSLPRAGAYTSWLGTLDSDDRLRSWKPLRLSSGSRITPITIWSPDSRHVAYGTANHAAGKDQWVIKVHDTATGEEREVYRHTADFVVCGFAWQHPNLFCTEFTPHTTEVFSLSVETGTVEQLASFPGKKAIAALSSDDQAFYLQTMPDSPELVRWDVGKRQTTATLNGCRTFPDGCIITKDAHRIARSEGGAIEIRSAPDGDWKRLAGAWNVRAIGCSGEPDPAWLFYLTSDAVGKVNLFRVSTAGGQPERLGDAPDNAEGMFVSPDGEKIIAPAKNFSELWLIENFEPKTPSRR